MKIININPVTKKRWRRFRRHRRAWYSLLLLGGLFALSLFAEQICNDRPLALRWNERWYFPAWRFYPENTFLDNEIFTRPDYKQLQQHPAAEGSRFIFAPVPFGPYETIDPESIPGQPGVELHCLAAPGMLAVYVRPDLTIARIDGQAFIDDPFALHNSHLEKLLPVSEQLKSALEQRFTNHKAPPLLESKIIAESRSVEVSLREYSPRTQPPRSVRIDIRDPAQLLAITETARLGIEQEVLPSFWEQLTAEQQAHIRKHAQQSETPVTSPIEVQAGGRTWRITIRTDVARWPHPPVRGHLMGIDTAGRDVFTRLLYGLRISLSFALLLVFSAMVVGSILGGIQGYFGGKTDITGQRLTEIWSALPFLYVMILLGSVYGRSFGLLLLCYALFNWIGLSYYMRAEFLRLRNQPFVDAARALGLPTWKIMLKHIFPNALTPLVTLFPFALVGAVTSLAGLDYLGFGLPPPTPSWGEMLHQAQQYRWAWWLITYPSAALFIVILLGVFIGEGVREAYDPKPYSRME